MKKRVLSFLLCLVMVFSLLPIDSIAYALDADAIGTEQTEVDEKTLIDEEAAEQQVSATASTNTSETFLAMSPVGAAMLMANEEPGDINTNSASITVSKNGDTSFFAVFSGLNPSDGDIYWESKNINADENSWQLLTNTGRSFNFNSADDANKVFRCYVMDNGEKIYSNGIDTNGNTYPNSVTPPTTEDTIPAAVQAIISKINNLPDTIETDGAFNSTTTAVGSIDAAIEKLSDEDKAFFISDDNASCKSARDRLSEVRNALSSYIPDAVKEIISDINALPALDNITEENARSVLNSVDSIESSINNLSPENKEYFDPDNAKAQTDAINKLAAVKEKCIPLAKPQVVKDIENLAARVEETGITSLEEAVNYYNEAKEIETAYNALPQADKDFIAKYYPNALPKLYDIINECLSKMAEGPYTFGKGPAPVKFKWNDNNLGDAARPDPVLTGATLSYTIYDKNNRPVKSGEVTDGESFKFIDNNYTFTVDDDNPILSADKSGIHLNSELPVSYKFNTYDPATAQEGTAEYTIKYTVNLNSGLSVPGYVMLNDNDEIVPFSDSVLPGDELILTPLIDWNASIYWVDNSNKYTTRPTIDEIRASDIKVFKTIQGSSATTEIVGFDKNSIVIENDTENVNRTIIKLNAGVPAFTHDGLKYNYSIKLPRFNAKDGDYYIYAYSNVDNNAANTSYLCDNGTVLEEIYGTTEFFVNKIWYDGISGEDVSGRSKPSFHVWRVPEENNDKEFNLDFPVPVDPARPSYPVDRTPDSGESITQYFGAGSITSLPKYNNYGVLNIYYGTETDFRPYTATISNYGNKYSNDIIEYFRQKSQTEGKVYFVNGSTVVNSNTESTTVSVTKQFDAQALLQILGTGENSNLSAGFILQKKVDEIWVNATGADLFVEDTTKGTITATISGFSTTNTSIELNSVDVPTLKKYDNAHREISYRWIETAISCGNETAVLDSNNWVEKNGKLQYKGTVYVNKEDGTAGVTGPEGTTAAFDVSMADGVAINELVGEHRLEIKKKFFDSTGNISADIEKLGNRTVNFTIYQDGNPYAVVEMGYNNNDEVVTGDDPYWHWDTNQFSYKLINSGTTKDSFVYGEIVYGDLPRYHDGGLEYRYTFEEWSRALENNYTVEPVLKNNILIKDTSAEFHNGSGGSALYFDVNKLWKDESTLESRVPVTFEIYRFKNIDGTLLETPELVYPTETGDNKLCVDNNWFRHVTISCESGDKVNNYIVLEKTMNPAGKADVDVFYNFEKSSAFFSSLLENDYDKLSTDYFIGTVGSTSSEGASWDGLSYVYKAYESRKNKSADYAEYFLTNVRTGLQELYFKKIWNTGATANKCKFKLYKSDVVSGKVLLAEIEIDPNLDGDARLNVLSKDDYTITIALNDPDSGLNTTDSRQISLKITGLPKFDSEGNLVECTIEETAMFDTITRNYVLFTDGNAEIEGNMVTSSSTKSPIGNNDVKEYHCSPDKYRYDFTNKISKTIPMEANKVWRDGNGLIIRPDISYSLYRASCADTVLNSYISQDNISGAANYLFIHKDLWNLVASDKYWDTSKNNNYEINKFWWSCQMENQEQFDGNGNPYVYFIVENMNSSTYQAYYCNKLKTEAYPNNPDKENVKTEEVFNIPASQLQSASEAVLIVADGKHTCSATVVNVPIGNRTVSGEKLWKLPDGWVIPDSNFPRVTVNLYRSSTKYKLSDYSDGNEYAHAIIAGCGNPVATTTLPGTVEGKPYSFKFENLAQYDEWGYDYYYYPLEFTPEGSLYKVNYYDNDFNMANIYDNETPWAEITVQKTWTIDSNVNDFDLSDSAKMAGFFRNMAPVTFNLTGKVTENGQPVEGSNIEFGSVKLEPGRGYSAGQTETTWTYVAHDLFGTDDIVTVNYNAIESNITATYTFKYYWNDLTDEKAKLPYYGPNSSDNKDNGKPLNYSVTEVSVSGFIGTSSAAAQSVTLAETTEGSNCYTNTANVANISNKYVGLTSPFSISFSKKWDDQYVLNDEYRPAYVVYLIKRYAGTNIETYSAGAGAGDKFNISGAKVYIPKNSTSNTWSVSGINYYDAANNVIRKTEGTEKANLLQYSETGEPFHYFIVGEYFADSDKNLLNNDSNTPIFAQNANDSIGHYKLSSKTENSATNSFVEQITSININKHWTANGKNLTYTEFNDLRNVGSLPMKVQYIIQRSTNPTAENPSWTEIDASELSQHDPGLFKINENGKDILGHEVVISNLNDYSFSSYLNFNLTWNKLPLKTDNDLESYTYRVVEKLFWADGVDTVKATNVIRDIHVGIAETDSETTKSFSFTNEVGVTKATFVKVWDDEAGFDNYRPDSIVLKIQRSATDPGNEYTLPGNEYTLPGIEYTLIAKNGDGTYYPVDEGGNIKYFYVGDNSAKDGSVNYIITERFVAPVVYTVNLGATPVPLQGEPTEGLVERTYSVTADAKKVFTAVTGTDYNYAINITNSLNEPRKTIKLDATKTWSGDDDWKDITRPDVYFKLQYKTQGANGDWTDFDSNPDSETNIKKFSSTETESIKKLTYTHTNSDGKPYEEWNNMYKYWKPNAVDGVAELIQYRVVECVDAAGNTQLSSSNTSYTPDNAIKEFECVDSDNTYSIDITNTLNKSSFKIKKYWSKDNDNNFSLDELKELIKLKAIPEAIQFVVEYYDTDAEKWIDVSQLVKSTGPISANTTGLTGGVTYSSTLPIYNKNLEKIQYRVREYAIKYSGGNYVLVNWSADVGTISNFTTSPEEIQMTTSLVTAGVKNAYDYTSLTLSKLWKDEDNRDGKRDDVKFTIYRDGVEYAEFDSKTGKITQTGTTGQSTVASVTKENNIWTFNFKYLPRLKNDGSGDSIYTWSETTGASGYTSNPDINNKNASSVTSETNTYNPARGTITATKTWNDLGDNFKSRPTEIYLKLQYKYDNTWYDVDHKDLTDGFYPDGKTAYTTSATIQKLNVAVSDNPNTWGTAKWENLPVNINVTEDTNVNNSSIVEYRVVEVTENGTIINSTDGYTSAAAEGVKLEKDSTRTPSVTNTLITGKAEIYKYWNSVPNVTPVSAVFAIEYYDFGNGKWKTYADNITLTAPDFSAEKQGLPIYSDKYSDYYKYRAKEVSVTYKVGNNQITVAATGAFDEESASWTGRAGLYNVAVNKSVSGTKGNTVFKFTANNTAPLGKVVAQKNWEDENNRDGNRAPVTLQLMRDGVAFGNTVTVSKDTGWKATFENLPIYKDDNSSNSVYTIKEVGEENSKYTDANGFVYDVSYSNGTNAITSDSDPESGLLTVTNARDPYSFNIKASKTWNDNDNKYGLRPDDISLTLKWSTDPDDSSSWNDVVKGHTAGDNSDVHTSSDPTQVLSKYDIPDNNNRNKWGYAIWNDLPAYVVVEENNVATSKLVYYRVVESGLPTSYTGDDSTFISFEDEELTQNTNSTTPQILVAHTSITNTLEGLTRLEVIKSFEDIADEDGYNVIPESVTVKLQYSKDNGVTWNDVAREGTAVLNKGNEWKYEWLGLRNDYEYRAAEVSIKYGDKTVAVSGDEISGTVGIFSYSAVTQKNSDNTKTTTKISNTLPDTSLSVTKIWQDDSNLEGERPDSITYKLYRDPTGENGQPSEDDTPFDIVTVSGDATTNNGWGYKWEKLPVYNNEGTAVSKYTVVEVPLAKELNYETTYNGCENITLDTTASYNGATVTNTRIYLDVEKKFENSTIYPIQIPVYITVQLQERDSVGYWRPVEGGSYDINAATGWKHRFTNLDASNEYRAVEVSLFYSDLGEIKVNDANTTSEDLNNRKAGNLYRCDSATEKEGAHFISTLTNTYIWHPIVPPPQPVPYIPGGKTAVTVTDTELEDPEVPKAKMPITGAESGDISLLPVVGGGLLGLAGIGGTLGALKKGRKKKENEESEVDESNNET